MSPKINVANASDRSWTRQSFVLWFGQCAPTYVLVYANDLDSALELAADWLADNAPGHLLKHSDPELQTLYAEACHELYGVELPAPFGCIDERQASAYEQATADLTYTEAGYLTSYEWGIVAENPTKAHLIALSKGR